jgi:hypothetical protein
MALLKRDLGGQAIRPYANRSGAAGLRNFLSAAIFSAHVKVLLSKVVRVVWSSANGD